MPHIRIMFHVISILLGLIAIGFGCATTYHTGTDPALLMKEQQLINQVANIRQSASVKGYLTMDELQTAISNLSVVGRDAYQLRQKALFYVEAINNDWLPFKALFYLSIEKEDYNEAEIIRRIWLSYLRGFVPHISLYANRPSVLHEAPRAVEKVEIEIEKLQIVGLTDPMLITLRKELSIALKGKQWDDAQKLQNLIASRAKEITPEPRVVERIIEKPSTGGQTTVVVRQPSEQNIRVEQIPRYGATDIGRAVSILDGKGGRLDPKAEGTLRLIDILLKR